MKEGTARKYLFSIECQHKGPQTPLFRKAATQARFPVDDDSREVKPAMRIAILEDSPTLAELLRIGLGIRGHTVYTFHQARPFVQAVLRDEPQFDAMICDETPHQQAEQSGADIIEFIRAILPEMPALIISGLDTPDLRAIERRLGNVPAIQKPFNLQILENTIRKIVYGPTH